MATSFTQQSATGSPQNFPLPPYIDKSHIQLLVDGVVTPLEPAAWVNDSTVNLTYPLGTVVRVFRSTSPDARLVDYMEGSALSETTLDLDSLQAFYRAQEIEDAIVDGSIVISAQAGDGGASQSAASAAESATQASSSAALAGSRMAAAQAATVAAQGHATVATNKAAEATTQFQNLDKRYLGAKTSDPTVDNQGAALIEGATYWSTSLTPQRMRVYSAAAWVDQSAAAGGQSGVLENLQVGSLTDIKSAPFVGNPRIYHQTNSVLDQSVFAKFVGGTVLQSDLGRTWQLAVIQTYEGQLAAGLNPVNVCAANVAFTLNVGTNPAVPARGSAINQQNVVTVAQTDTSWGPNEYANTVYLLDPTLGKSNGGNTMWGNDWTVYGAKDGADYALYGTTQMICKWNPGAATSGQASIGVLATTRPRGGAGAQNRTGLTTFTVDAGFAVSGFAGLNDVALLPGGHHANALKGFEYGFAVGGKLGPWMNEPGVYSGGSKVGTAFYATDFVDYGLRIAAKHPFAAAGALAILTHADAGNVSFGNAAPDASNRVTVEGSLMIGGAGWNSGRLKLGAYQLWFDGAGKLRSKTSNPTSDTDGTLVGGAAAAATTTIYAGCVSAAGTGLKVPAGWAVGRSSLGLYRVDHYLNVTPSDYAITATCSDGSPGSVRRHSSDGTGFYVETVDGGGVNLADRSFNFHVVKV